MCSRLPLVPDAILWQERAKNQPPVAPRLPSPISDREIRLEGVTTLEEEMRDERRIIDLCWVMESMPLGQEERRMVKSPARRPDQSSSTLANAAWSGDAYLVLPVSNAPAHDPTPPKTPESPSCPHHQ